MSEWERRKKIKEFNEPTHEISVYKRGKSNNNSTIGIGYNSCCHCSFLPFYNIIENVCIWKKYKLKSEKIRKRKEMRTQAGKSQKKWKKKKKKLLIVRYENAGNSQVSLLLIYFPLPSLIFYLFHQMLLLLPTYQSLSLCGIENAYSPYGWITDINALPSL